MLCSAENILECFTAPFTVSCERSELKLHEGNSDTEAKWSETKEMFSDLPEHSEGANQVV